MHLQNYKMLNVTSPDFMRKNMSRHPFFEKNNQIWSLVNFFAVDSIVRLCRSRSFDVNLVYSSFGYSQSRCHLVPQKQPRTKWGIQNQTIQILLSKRWLQQNGKSRSKIPGLKCLCVCVFPKMKGITTNLPSFP